MIAGINKSLSPAFAKKKNAGYPGGYVNPSGFQSRLIDRALHAKNSLNGKQVTIYMDCLVSQVSGSGQELHMKYDESSTEENPVIYAWGKDLSGKEFETKIFVNEINPYHASPAEMKALHAHLAKQEQGVKGNTIPIDAALGSYDVNERINFVQYLEEWNDMQELAKNPSADLGRLQLEQYLGATQNAGEIVSQYQERLEQELLFRKNHPLESRIREKEERTLFQEESQDVFDSKTFLEILGITLEEEINWNADGTSELTESQIRYLKEKYDVQNLSRSDFYNLLAELSNRNVISYEDIQNQFIRQADPAVMEKGFMLVAADRHFSQWMHSENDYLSRFQNEVSLYDFLMQAIMEGKSSVDAAVVPAVIAYYEKQKAFSGKLAAIFEKLKRDDRDASVRTERLEEKRNGWGLVGTNIPETVENAWNKAEKEAGVNGVAMGPDGKLSQLTELFVMSLEKYLREGNADVLGNTEKSAREAVQKALERLGAPWTEEEKKEKLFYEAFLRYLY